MRSIRTIAQDNFTGIQHGQANPVFSAVTQTVVFKKEKFIEEISRAFEENGVLFLEGSTWHRCIGKTTFLKEVAKEYGFYIITRFVSKRDDNGVKMIPINNDGALSALRTTNHKYVLCDELEVKDIQKLRELGLIPLGFATRYSQSSFYII